MGCDIHTFAEKKTETGWKCLDFQPFSERNYALFGLLADVRNYAAVTPVAAKRGIPRDCDPFILDEWDRMRGDAHSASWISMEELKEIRPETEVENRRVTGMLPETRILSGGCTCEKGKGKKETLLDFLGDHFFQDVATLEELGAGRVVFWFDC